MSDYGTFEKQSDQVQLQHLKFVFDIFNLEGKIPISEICEDHGIKYYCTKDRHGATAIVHLVCQYLNPEWFKVRHPEIYITDNRYCNISDLRLFSHIFIPLIKAKIDSLTNSIPVLKYEDVKIPSISGVPAMVKEETFNEKEVKSSSQIHFSNQGNKMSIQEIIKLRRLSITAEQIFSLLEKICFVEEQKFNAGGINGGVFVQQNGFMGDPRNPNPQFNQQQLPRFVADAAGQNSPNTSFVLSARAQFHIGVNQTNTILLTEEQLNIADTKFLELMEILFPKTIPQQTVVSSSEATAVTAEQTVEKIQQ